MTLLLQRFENLSKGKIMQMNEFHVVFATHVELFYKKKDAGDMTC